MSEVVDMNEFESWLVNHLWNHAPHGGLSLADQNAIGWLIAPYVDNSLTKKQLAMIAKKNIEIISPSRLFETRCYIAVHGSQ